MKLVYKLLLPKVLFVVFLVLFVGLYARGSLRNALFSNEFYAMQESVASHAATRLSSADFADPQSDAAQTHFADFTEGISDSTTARVTIWNSESRIVYSDLTSIIGIDSPGRVGLEDVLKSGKPTFHAQAKDDEFPRQTDVGEFLDIYIPISAGGKTAGAVEVHSVIGAVLLPMQRQVRELLLILIVGTLLLIAVLFAVSQYVIVTPMKKVNRFIKAVESGDFGAKLDIRSKDEMGELGASLDRMAAGLRRLQELKNEFVFLASHELRAPVAVIKGYLALIEEDGTAGLSDSTRSYLVNVEKAGDRLGQLVDDLLEIARSESGKLGVTLGPCDLPDAVLAIIEEQNVLASRKGIIITYDRTTPPHKVLADEDRLKEVLANLLSNAVKYSPEGTAIKVYHESRDGEVVTSVRDAGYGIPEKEQRHVFEKFFRSGERVIRDMPGTGLGLFITKQLVEKMNGKIWFTTKEKGGTTFSFSLKKA